MNNYIFDTNLYYYSEEAGKLRTERFALTYPWRTPHVRDIMRWGSFDDKGYPPFFGIHPLILLRGACSVLSMMLSERAYFFKYDAAVSRDMSKSFHSERYISLYKQKNLEQSKRIKALRSEKLNHQNNNSPVNGSREECERVLRREEYHSYLQLHPEALSREMEFYYSLKGRVCTLVVSKWAPIQLKADLWEYKPCVVTGEGHAPLYIAGGQAEDPLHALIASLQSVTQYLVTYAEECGILHYYVTREDAVKKADSGNPFNVAYIKYTLKTPVLWGLAFRMESTDELIMD